MPVSIFRARNRNSTKEYRLSVEIDTAAGPLILQGFHIIKIFILLDTRPQRFKSNFENNNNFIVQSGDSSIFEYSMSNTDINIFF